MNRLIAVIIPAKNSQSQESKIKEAQQSSPFHSSKAITKLKHNLFHQPIRKPYPNKLQNKPFKFPQSCPSDRPSQNSNNKRKNHNNNKIHKHTITYNSR
jgi:hypothetical protein